MEGWIGRWITGLDPRDAHCNEGFSSVCHAEDLTELKGKVFDLLVHQHSTYADVVWIMTEKTYPLSFGNTLGNPRGSWSVNRECIKKDIWVLTLGLLHLSGSGEGCRQILRA